jgi:hypothetical protein
MQQISENLFGRFPVLVRSHYLPQIPTQIRLILHEQSFSERRIAAQIIALIGLPRAMKCFRDFVLSQQEGKSTLLGKFYGVSKHGFQAAIR